MAIFEKVKMKLNPVELDVHLIIERAIDNFALQIGNRGGVIRKDFQATFSLAMIDEIHFLNTISNLIDNGIKYSKDCPEITISTRNIKNSISISIEDKDFYKNQGYSITGYIRSILNLFLFRGLSGGSTITQQLIKETLLTSERTIPRKIKEFILAVEVDKKYSKNQILELYLNVAPYGGPNVGVETASEGYFGKKVSIRPHRPSGIRQLGHVCSACMRESSMKSVSSFPYIDSYASTLKLVLG